MRFNDVKKQRCDVLVIGGGGAGLRAAIAARQAGADTLIVSKARVGYASNTTISKATIAVSGLGPVEDGPAVHEKDTLEGGRFLNDADLVRVMARRIGEEIRLLQSFGVGFARQGDGLKVIHTPGHSHARHVFAPNRVGSELTLPLRGHAAKIGARFAEGIFVTRLFTADNGVSGAAGVDATGCLRLFQAGAVVLATGGYAPIYLHNNNAAGLTGDGHILAFDAGVGLKDMEFVQFYPTASGPHGSRLVLYEVLVFQAGAILKNAQGEDILAKYGLKDPGCATRDRVARAIMQEIAEGRGIDGGVLMDFGDAADRLSEAARRQLPAYWKPADRVLRVCPTAHFCMGGIVVDPGMETALSGLFGAGEICAGMHGANRLGGNALAEVFVMGATAGQGAAARAKAKGIGVLDQAEVQAEKARLEAFGHGRRLRAGDLTGRLKEVMWRRASIMRSRQGLEEALGAIGQLGDQEADIAVNGPKDLRAGLEFGNLRRVAEMVCRAALMRAESRGAHFRSDYPDEDDDNWLASIVISGQAGQITPTHDKHSRAGAWPVDHGTQEGLGR